MAFSGSHERVLLTERSHQVSPELRIAERRGCAILVTWVFVAGPVSAGPIRSWLDLLPLDLPAQSVHDAADTLTGGRPVRGVISPPGQPALPLTIGVDRDGLVLELDGPPGDDTWWARLVTDAGRVLLADTVALIDDPAAILPRLFWISTSASGNFADARARATTVESQWDGAILLYR